MRADITIWLTDAPRDARLSTVDGGYSFINLGDAGDVRIGFGPPTRLAALTMLRDKLSEHINELEKAEADGLAT